MVISEKLWVKPNNKIIPSGFNRLYCNNKIMLVLLVLLVLQNKGLKPFGLFYSFLNP